MCLHVLHASEREEEEDVDGRNDKRRRRGQQKRELNLEKKVFGPPNLAAEIISEKERESARARSNATYTHTLVHSSYRERRN